MEGLWRNRGLIFNLVKREVVERYRGSVLGILWSFFNPILMLAVYTFFFSVVFKSRWVGGSGSKTEFALILFAGLMVFNLFAECVNRAPTLIVSNVNFVKKIVFPLEILPAVAVGSALFHMLVSLSVWLLFYAVLYGVPHISILMLPVAIVPLLVFTFGVSLFLASLGVFLRDVAQVVSVMTTALMFLSPVFYPSSVLPEAVRGLVGISPLTFVVEQAREVMIWGNAINLRAWLIYFLASLAVLWLGFIWFQKTRKGFADVL